VAASGAAAGDLRAGGVAVARGTSSVPGPKAAPDKAGRALSKFEVEQLARIEVMGSHACNQICSIPPPP
jgi:hypothetical protein